MSALVAADLGRYLKDRRTRLDPAALGLPVERRRTKGLRREEVALRASISPVWYTWLEQGRGGVASAHVLERIADALLLTGAERDHLFLIALGSPSPFRYGPPPEITPHLQHVLDALDPSPALIRTATWDVVAWNRSATLVLANYGALSPPDRNVLRLLFLNGHIRDAHEDWEQTARFVIGVFRADIARAGAAPEVADLIAELGRISPDFDRIWRENDVRGHGEGLKRLRHPAAGLLAFRFSAFAIDGRPDLSMIVYEPRTKSDADRIRTLVAGSCAGSHPASI